MIRLDLPAPARRVSAPPKRRYFSGAQATRLTSDWVTAPLSADEEIKKSLRRLRDRARALAHDAPHGARFVQLLKLHVVGPEGIGFQSRAYSTRDRLHESLNERVERAWRMWGEAGHTTMDARLSWFDVQELAIGALATDGEFLARKVVSREAPHGFWLEVLDPDLLDEGLNGTLAGSGHKVVMGVELGARNQPVAYHLFTAHPSEAGNRRDRVRVPASEVLHLFVSDRPGQTRGYPMMAAAMLGHRYLDAYCEAHITAARQAAIKPIVYTQSTDGPGTGSEYAEERIVEELEPGLSHLLPQGVEAHLLDPAYPTSTYKEFEKAMLMRIAAGYGISYTSLSGDLESVNYSSIRAGLLDERDYYRVLQGRLVRGLCKPVFADWLKTASMRGMLPAISVQQEDEIKAQALWKPRGWAWVDPLNDMQALEREIRLGINTRTRAAAERGRDFEDNLDVLQQEQNLAAQYGIEVNGTDGQMAPRPDAAPEASEDAEGAATTESVNDE